MKQEFKDIIFNLFYQAPMSFAAWWHQASITTILAALMGVLQIAYLIRKWVREETEWGVKIKKLARPTQPGSL